jgi:hypothetical protein
MESHDEKSIVFASDEESEERAHDDAASAFFEVESSASPDAKTAAATDDEVGHDQPVPGCSRSACAPTASQGAPEITHQANPTRDLQTVSPVETNPTPMDGAAAIDEQSIHFEETSSVATSHRHVSRRQDELAPQLLTKPSESVAASGTDIEFAEETQGEDEMSTMFAVAPTDDGSLIFLAQSQVSGREEHPRGDAKGATTSSESNLVKAESSIQFGIHDEVTTDDACNSKPPSLHRKASSGKPVEHSSPWNCATSKSPHHMRYQPGKAAALEEQQWAEKHPMWTKPKGSTTVTPRQGESPSSAKGVQLLSTASEKSPSEYPYGQFGPRARQFSEKLRREASEKSVLKSSSTSVREEPNTGAAAHAAASSPKIGDTGLSARRSEGRTPAERKASSPGDHNTKPRIPPRQLKEQVEQWMKDHIPSSAATPGRRRAQAQSGGDEVSLSPGSSEQDGGRSRKRSKPRPLLGSPPRGESSKTRNSGEQGLLSATQPARTRSTDNVARRAEQQVLSDRPRNFTDPIFEKLYHAGNKDAKEAYIREQLQREEADLKLKRLVMLYGPSKGQREFDRLYGQAALDAPKRSATPPAWQRLYTTPTKRTPSNDPNAKSADRGQTSKAVETKPAQSRTSSPRPPVQSGGPSAQQNEDEIHSRLYKMGLSELQRKQRLADEAEAKRLQAEQLQIEEGKRLARALRQKSGHQQMTREEYEALVKEQPGVATEPKLTEEQLNAVYARLLKQGKKKLNQALVDRVELKECTFHPVVNPSPSRGRSAHVAGHAATTAVDDSGCFASSTRQRSPSCDKACLKLYQNAEKVRCGRSELAGRVDRERRLKLLKARMNSDHHFLRRVQLDPSIAEVFMAALPPQI